jgi:hypothetical protein
LDRRAAVLGLDRRLEPALRVIAELVVLLLVELVVDEGHDALEVVGPKLLRLRLELAAERVDEGLLDRAADLVRHGCSRI